MTDPWAGRRVFVTGHTGFKGSWLALWLADLGAEVTGYALPPPTKPSLFEAARIAELVTHVEGDVRDAAALSAAIERARPEIVFHLAAQPLVRLSYDQPVETYATNVMGTVHLLDALRRVAGVRAAICVTSDKCYENREWVWPYRESDPMGGHDPYSNSKGCAELVVAAFRSSYFGETGPALASARAGNVIGGGDWAADRLVPDIVRALERGERPAIRNPGSIRPWQHVLEALGGYLRLGERLLAGERALAEGWNFGPADEDTRPVGWIVERMLALWDEQHRHAGPVPASTARPSSDVGPSPAGGPRNKSGVTETAPHEARTLRLDCSKARARLGWRSALTLETALERVVDFHRRMAAGEDVRTVALDQIRDYRALVAAQTKDIAWA